MKNVALLLTLSVAVWAQADRARIVGTVSDPTGATISNAKVTAKDAKTGAAREVNADEKGFYILTNLAPSDYVVTASSEGLGPAEHSGVHLSVGQERTLDFVLQPASVRTEVTVSGGELSTVDTSSAEMGANINSREVASLPLNGRQLSQLYLLAPGAQTAGGGSFDNIRFSGRANQENEIKFDGIEGSSIIDSSPGNLDGEVSTGFRLQSSLETVAEFQVQSSNYPAEYGTGTAGQISVVTKSGGNVFHGSLFEYLRNDALDSRNFFDGAAALSLPKNPLRLNQYGASLGGPVIKDKLFFFVSQESLRQRAGVNLIGTVPSASARARAVASIRPLLAGYPQGQISTSNPDLDIAQGTFNTSIDEYFGNVRLDYHFNDKYSMYMRYNRDQGYLQAPADVSGGYQVVTGVPQNAVYTLQQVLKPTVINETKIGINANKTRISGFTPPIPGVDTGSGLTISFTGGVAIPGIGGQGASAGASVLGNLVRANSAQNGRNEPYTGYTLGFIDNLSVIKQQHALKFGFEFRPIRLWTDRFGGTTYTFSNIAALLANTPSSVQVLGDTSAPDPWNNGATGNRLLKQYYMIFYAQDEWKIRPNLTMSYGLRYEYYQPLHEDRNLFVLFNANTGQLACGTTPGCNLPNTTPWFNSSKLNFGPRLAFSWAPEALKNRTVLRIGAGYYFGPGQTEDQVQPIDSDRSTRTLSSGVAFPVVPSQILAAYNINDPSLGYQPRAYGANYQIPEKILSYTASIQHTLPGDAVLTVAYVGSQGRNLFLRSWTNQLIGVTMNPASGAGVAVTQFGNRFAAAGIDFKTSGGTDHYESLQTTLNRRFSRGLTAGLQWTYGHSIGNTGGSNEAQTAQNPYNFGQDRGNNAFDVRHSMNFSALYELPFKLSNQVANSVLGGWEVGGIVNARTGLPIDVTISRPDIVYQVNGTNNFVSAAISPTATTPVINNPFGGAFRSNRRPDVVAGVDPFLHTTDGRYFLNPAAFSIPRPGQYGNLGRYALHGPGLSQLDFTVHKRFAVTERQNVEFRAEFYNILNHTNFANPPATLSNALGTGTNQLQPGQPFTPAAAGSAFGVFNSTVSKDVGLGAQRQIQLSLRYNF